MEAGLVSAAHNYRVSQGGPSIQLRAFKGQCNYYSVEIRCVPRSCKPICLHRNIQISALFSVHTQLAAHILSSYWYPEWTLGPSGDRDKGEKAKTIILKKLVQVWGRKKKRQHFMILGWVLQLVSSVSRYCINQPGHTKFLPLVLLWMISYHVKKKKMLRRGREYFFWKRLVVSGKEHHFIRLLSSRFLRSYSVSLWPWHPFFREHWYKSGIWWTSDELLQRQQVMNTLALHKLCKSAKSNLKEH